MVNEWLKRISYKAGWTFSAETLDNEVVRLTASFTGPSSVAGEPDRIISHAVTNYWPVRTFEDLVYFMRELIRELENHEMREWFRVDGQHWSSYLPHDPETVGPGRNTGARYD